MKRSITYFHFAISMMLLLVACADRQPSANLLVNGNAEMPRYDSVPNGWLNVQGHWVSPQGDSASHDCTFAQNGNHLFFAGNDTLGILQQDVDVTAYSKPIDAWRQQFIFNGYVQSLDQGPTSDQAQIIITALDGSKNKTLYSFDTDSTRSLNKWLRISDTVIAPATTRFIRVRLIAIRHVGGDNDGYFDNILLTTQTIPNELSKWLLAASIAALLITVTVIYLKKQNAKSSLYAH